MNICFSPLYRFKITPFQNHEFFFKITNFSKSRLFQNHTIFKITLFTKSHDFQNHIIYKITRFQNHIISKITRFQNHAIFLGFLIIFKTSVFLKIPRLTICKKAVFSVQDLGFRL